MQERKFAEEMRDLAEAVKQSLERIKDLHRLIRIEAEKGERRLRVFDLEEVVIKELKEQGFSIAKTDDGLPGVTQGYAIYW